MQRIQAFERRLFPVNVREPPKLAFALAIVGSFCVLSLFAASLVLLWSVRSKVQAMF
jgi:hypothetical protein